MTYKVSDETCRDFGLTRCPRSKHKPHAHLNLGRRETLTIRRPSADVTASIRMLKAHMNGMSNSLNQ